MANSEMPAGKLVPYQADWSLFARRVAAVALLVMFVFIVSLIGPIRDMVLLALIVSFLLIYPILLLMRVARLSYLAAAIIVFAVYLILLILLIVFVAGPFVAFWGVLTDGLTDTVDQILVYLQDYDPSGQTIDLSPLSQLADVVNFDQLLGTGVGLLGTLVDSVFAFGGALYFAFLFNLMALVFLTELPAGLKYAFKLIPRSGHREYAILFTQMGQVWTAFWKGSIIAALITAGAAYLQLMLMGIPYAGFLALIAGLMTFIPWVGSIIAAIPMFIVPFVLGSTTLDMDPLALAILVTVIYQLGQLILWNFVIPKLYGKVLDLSASLLVIVIGIGTAWWGLLGAILAIPVAVILLQAVKFVLHKIRGGDPYPDEPEPKLLTQGAFGLGPLVSEQVEES